MGEFGLPTTAAGAGNSPQADRRHLGAVENASGDRACAAAGRHGARRWAVHRARSQALAAAAAQRVGRTRHRKPYHEISVSELLRLFRRFGRTDLGTRGKIKLGKIEEETEAAALWDSMRRLVKTTVEWEDEDYQGISALVSEALMNKRYRETAKSTTPSARAFRSKSRAARLCAAALSCRAGAAQQICRHLYEILEAYVNRREAALTVSIEDFGRGSRCRKTLTRTGRTSSATWCCPPSNEINEHGEEGGFFVSYEGVREGKASPR